MQPVSINNAADLLLSLRKLRNPVPKEFIYIKPKAGNVEYVPWSTIADILDHYLPGRWSFIINEVKYQPTGRVQYDTFTDREKNVTRNVGLAEYSVVTHASIIVHSQDLLGYDIVRSNLGQESSFEARTGGTFVPNEKDALSSAHNALKRAAAMLGVARGLYVRDDSKEPIPYDISDILAFRDEAASLADCAYQEIKAAVATGAISELAGLDFVSEINDILSCETAEKKADASLAAVEQVVDRIRSKAIPKEATVVS